MVDITVGSPKYPSENPCHMCTGPEDPDGWVWCIEHECYVKRGTNCPGFMMKAPVGIQLGDEVKDRISGFKGVAVARVEWIFGCTRWVVQPKVKTNGEYVENLQFDEDALEVVKKGKVVRGEPTVTEARETGGPIPKVSQATVRDR